MLTPPRASAAIGARDEGQQMSLADVAAKRYPRISPHMWGALDRYLEHGIPPGSFLEAVLANDFLGAAGRVDENNGLCLNDWARVVFNELPQRAHGSRERIGDWINSGGFVGQGQTAAAEVEAEIV